MPDFVVLTLITMIGGVSAAAIAALCAYCHSKWKNRLQIRRIVRTNDDHLESVINLHLKLFNPSLGVHPDMLERSVRRIELRQEGLDPDWEEFVIKACRKSLLLGYLYATYNYSTQYLFVSYVGVEEDVRSVSTEVAQGLLRGILKEITKRVSRSRGNLVPSWAACQFVRRRYACKAIIGELDMEELRNGRRKCELLLSRFQRYARNDGMSCYALVGLNYQQPVLEISEIANEDASNHVPAAGRQLIVLVPVDEPFEDQYMSRERGASILEFIIVGVYGKTLYYDDPERSLYYDYCKRYYDQCLRALPDAVCVKSASKRFTVASLAKRPSGLIPPPVVTGREGRAP